MSAYERSLRQLHGQKLLQALDLHFALFLMSQAPEAGELAALTFALVSRATSEGHVCLDLHSLSGQYLLPGAPAQYQAPSVTAWRELLLESGVVGQPGEWQPLILDAANRLYLHRYWAYERALGLSLLERSDGLMEGIDEERLRSGLDLLFKPPSEGQIDWQRIASATAVLRRLSIISGGPGTGKTTTVVRILALLRDQPGGAGIRIALAAPTGMAASRLQQSIRHAKSRLRLASHILEAIPEQAMTLHRLLGVRPQGTGYRHDRDNPLPLDVLVLDEASMVDVALMAKLLEALPEQARLILLGDRDQLASVEAGAVLGDLCAGCEGPDLHFVERLQQVTDLEFSDSPGSQGALRNSVVLLRRSYRFDSESPIGQLAAAVNQGDAQTAESLLRRAPTGAGIGWLEAEPTLANLAAEHYAELLRQAAEGVPAGQLFETLQRYRVLCALRAGPFGAERLNLAITHRLKMMGLVALEGEWFPGRPVMVTRNDYQLGLYNGDTGIVLPHPDDPRLLAVAFAAGDGQQPRWIAPARLPGCETVFALTVHKSQGSEFGQVALQLPDQLSPVLCRELIYTAITRAREGFFIAGSAEVFRGAVSRRLSRHSGLVDLLNGERGAGEKCAVL